MGSSVAGFSDTNETPSRAATNSPSMNRSYSSRNRRIEVLSIDGA